MKIVVLMILALILYIECITSKDREDIFIMGLDGNIDIIYQNAIETFGWDTTYDFDSMIESHMDFISLMDRIGSEEGYEKVLNIIDISIQRARDKISENPSMVGVAMSLEQNYKYREWFRMRHNL